MLNTFETPEWLLREFRKEYHALPPVQIGETIKIRLPKRFIHHISPPISGKALVAIGAAAVIANPRPLSRRSFFRFGL